VEAGAGFAVLGLVEGVGFCWLSFEVLGDVADGVLLVAGAADGNPDDAGAGLGGGIVWAGPGASSMR